MRTRKRRRHYGAAWALLGVGMGAAIVAGGCGSAENALVGGSCSGGYTECSLKCVDLLLDNANCGACGNVCAVGRPCVGGVCGGSVDAAFDTTGDSSLDGATETIGDESGESDGARRDGSDGSAQDSGDACTPPYVTAAHCGDCFTVCSGVNDTCTVGDAGTYVCAPLCSPPLSNCSGTCVNESSDPDNCGACNRVCQSSICTAKVCQGAANGDVVYIGHDYLATPFGTSQARELTNAVFLASGNPIRVLSFEKYSDAGAVGRVKNILAMAGAASGRSVAFTVSTTAGDIPANLTIGNYDVLLVYDQTSAPPGTLGPMGASWSAAVASFTHVGGVFVTLDGDTTTGGGTGEMPLFESGTGQLSVTSHAPMILGALMTVSAPLDAVGNGVVSPYAARRDSAHFASEPNGGSVVYVAIDQTTSEPVVVHKIAP